VAANEMRSKRPLRLPNRYPDADKQPENKTQAQAQK